METNIKNMIPEYWNMKIIHEFKRAEEFRNRVNNDKDLTKKQKKKAIRLYDFVGGMWANPYILGCKLKRDYTLRLKWINGSYCVVQKFNNKDIPKTKEEINREIEVLSEVFNIPIKKVEKIRENAKKK